MPIGGVLLQGILALFITSFTYGETGTACTIFETKLLSFSLNFLKSKFVTIALVHKILYCFLQFTWFYNDDLINYYSS